MEEHTNKLNEEENTTFANQTAPVKSKGCRNERVKPVLLLVLLRLN
jgi:hypothetical protein